MLEQATAMNTLPHKPSEEENNSFSIFPPPEENYKVHTEIFFSNHPVFRACASMELLEEHFKVTRGKVFPHFPPEPNGYLHVGYAKVMFADFGLAKEKGGCCYLSDCSLIRLDRLECHIREELNKTTPRTMVVITNLEAS